jgi:hypothetical protein
MIKMLSSILYHLVFIVTRYCVSASITHIPLRVIILAYKNLYDGTHVTPLQESAKFTRAQITYDGPLVSYLTYDDPNSALVDYSNLRRPRLDLRRLSLNYDGPNATVVDYL